MKLIVSKDIAGLRAAAIRRVYATAGLVRTRFATNIPGQEMIYLEKAAEARRFLAAYPTASEAPTEISADPETGYPFIAAEIGITAGTAHEVAGFYVAGASLFRQAGAAIDGIRLGYARQIETAATPAAVESLEDAALAAFAALPLPSI